MENSLIKIQEEVAQELASPEVMTALITTTFKGLSPENVKKAIVEGMMRGFKFKDFLEKNVYAIPFQYTYSLVTSIDHARKVGMKSGIVGKSAPIFEEKDGKILSCSITVKRKVNEYVGEYTATVYFNEYTTGRNLWNSKPRTMIAKVAEMHALRMACPEELAQSYTEEELEKETSRPPIDFEECKGRLETTQNMDELKSVWASLPVEAKQELQTLKEDLKTKHEINTIK